MRKALILAAVVVTLMGISATAAGANGDETCYWERADAVAAVLAYHTGDITRAEAVQAILNYHAMAPKPCGDTESTTYRGITIAPEDRCTDYDRDDYSYPQSVEADIVAGMGGIIYGPYTGTHFDSTDETDIEHIVATSEAHDSGMCDEDDDTKSAFARDLLNLTLASPSVNRHQKRANDAAEWLPALNQCWYADRIVQVRVKYELTVDQTEADALEDVLEDCESTDMIITER